MISATSPSLEVYLDDFSTSAESPQITANVWSDWLQSWLTILRSNLPQAPSYEVGLRLTDDQEIRRLNAQYRQQDQPTDVLSFAALEVDTAPISAACLAAEPLYLGDIVISIETAKRQALERQHSLRWELVWLVSHGFLHLLGWDHPDEESLEQMLAQQETLLESIGLKEDNSVI
jgi:probable rRNA maturation factor